MCVMCGRARSVSFVACGIATVRGVPNGPGLVFSWRKYSKGCVHHASSLLVWREWAIPVIAIALLLYFAGAGWAEEAAGELGGLRMGGSSDQAPAVNPRLGLRVERLEPGVVLLVSGLFTAAAFLTVAFAAKRRLRMEKRLQNLERRVGELCNEPFARHSSGPFPKGTLVASNEVSGQPLSFPVPVPVRPAFLPPRDPAEAMQLMIEWAAALKHFRAAPQLPDGPWSLGLATTKGNVRPANEDYGLCFKIRGYDVLVVGDGCGGLPHGQRAAYLAVLAAAASVIRAYAMGPHWRVPLLEHAVRKAIGDAGHRLAMEGDKMNVLEVRDGLRTTLIIVIGDTLEFGFGYIGDGGGRLVRCSGEIINFLHPQKASGNALNVLAASLGPKVEGEPVTGVLERCPGDFLMVGTDGVFDRVDEAFPKDVLRGAIQREGDLQKVAECVLDDLARFQDGAGYVCDDNLTLGIMGDGKAPRLCRGFWRSGRGGEANPGQAAPGKDVVSQVTEGR